MNLKEANQLLILASAIDSRQVTDVAINAWQQVLADVDYRQAEQALISHRRNSPGVYLEPGHIIAEIRKGIARRREIRGWHPDPPAGQRWAVDAIDGRKEIER